MRSVSLQAITQLLIDFYAVSFEEITHPSDADKLMILYICVYLVKSNTCYSDSSIAEFFNIEDEDDIERIVDSVSEFMRSRFAFRAEIDILKEIIHEEFASTARNIYKKNYIEKDKPDPINILTGS